MFSRRQSKANKPPVPESLVRSFVDGIDGARQAASNARITAPFTPSEPPKEALAQAKAERIPENRIHSALHATADVEGVARQRINPHDLALCHGADL